MKVWRLISHHEDEHKEAVLRWAVTSGRLALGWGEIGDLALHQHTSPDSIRDLITRTYPGSKNANCGGQSLWDLWRNVNNDDLVILGTGRRRSAVMRVIGPYEFAPRGQAPGAEGYQHQREAEQIDTDADVLWERAGGQAPGTNVYCPLIPCRLEVV